MAEKVVVRGRRAAMVGVSVVYVAAALATIAVGLAVHLRGRALSGDVRDVLGDALWAAMIYWGVGAGWPDAPSARRAAATLAVAWAVEFSQCYHAPALDAVRATTLGNLVLGSAFDPRDLLSYAFGVVAAVGGERGVRSLVGRR